MHLLILFTAFLYLNALPLPESNESDLNEIQTKAPASPHYSPKMTNFSMKNKNPSIISKRPQFSKTSSVKKEIVNGENFSKRLELSPFYPCDHYDEQKKECTYIRSLGTTLTFGVQFATKGDESNPLQWFRFFKINDEGRSIYKQALHRDAMPWNVNIGGDNTELRISPVTETDFSYNFFLVSLGDASPKDQQYIKFVIEPIDVDMGPLYQGEEIAINIRSFIEFPKRSLKFEWSTVQLKEGSLAPGNLRSNMRLIRDGSGLIIKEHKNFEDITLTCAMYSDKGFFVARRNFFLRKTATLNEPDGHRKESSKVFHRAKKSLDEADIGQEYNFQNVFIPPLPHPKTSDNILKPDQVKEFLVNPKNKRLQEKYFNHHDNAWRTRKVLNYLDHPQPPERDLEDHSFRYDDNFQFKQRRVSSGEEVGPFIEERHKIKDGRAIQPMIYYQLNPDHSGKRNIFKTAERQLDNQLPHRLRKKRSIGNGDEHSYFLGDVAIPWQTSFALENKGFGEEIKRRWDSQGFPLIDPSSTPNATSRQSLQQSTNMPTQSQTVRFPNKSTNRKLLQGWPTKFVSNTESPSYSRFLSRYRDRNALNDERKISIGNESKQMKMAKFLSNKRILGVTIEEAINRIRLSLGFEKRTEVPTEFLYNAASKAEKINLMSVRASEAKTMKIGNNENDDDAMVLASEVDESSFYYQSLEVESNSFHFRFTDDENNKRHFWKDSTKNNFSIKSKDFQNNSEKIKIDSTENNLYLSSPESSQQTEILLRESPKTKEFNDVVHQNNLSSDLSNNEERTYKSSLVPSHKSRSITRRKRSIDEFYSYPSTLHRFRSFRGKKSIVSREVQEGESMSKNSASRQQLEDEEDSRSQAFRYVRETSPNSEDSPYDYPTPPNAFDEIEMTETEEPTTESNPGMPMNFYNVRKPLEDTSTSSHTLQPSDGNRASRLNKLIQEANNIAEDAADDRKLKKLKVISNDKMKFGDRESLLIHSCNDDSDCGVYAACFQIASGDTFCKCKAHYRGNGLFCWLL